jgi:hypothetical protein
MQRRPALSRVPTEGRKVMKLVRIGVLAAALVAGTLVGAPVAQADVVVEQRFAADSGDKCGVTKGDLAWYQTPRVDVVGVLHDLPCDGLFSAATFTAFAGGKAVDEQRVRADDGAVEFTFPLVNLRSAPLEKVTVQVCRFPVEIGISYCGPLREFRSPIVSS